MAVDLIKIHEQIKQFGHQIIQKENQRLKRLAHARELFNHYSNKLDFLIEQVNSIIEKNISVRCAKPETDALNSTSCPDEMNGNPMTILAADGSQILPDRHRKVEFGLINIAVMKLDPVLGIQKPLRKSTLLLPDGSQIADEQLNEAFISLKRDTQERQFLAETATRENPPVIAFTDGPLELFQEPRSGKQYQNLFRDYLQALSDFSKSGGIPAGYVDRPKADLVVRLLELSQMDLKNLKNDINSRSLKGVTDTDLFIELLKPGERSGIFNLESSSARLFKEFDSDVALSFFYINTSSIQSRFNSLVRVEIPAKVANNPDMIDILHKTILNQCKIMGSRPYPYLLHRAHEEAVVTYKESEQIEELLITQLVSKDLKVFTTSNKQTLKILSNEHKRFTI